MNDSAISTVEAPKKKAFVPAFAVGDEQAKRFNGRTVGVIVSVNVSHKDQGREGDACIPLYEVPLMRRMYERNGGTLIMRPNWVPSIPRHRLLTDVLFDDKNPNDDEALGELNRLRRTYKLKNGQTVVDIMAEVYGPTKAEQARNLQKGMRDIYEGWKVLYEKAKGIVLSKHKDIQDEVLALFKSDEEVTVKVYQATLDAWMLELTGLEITTNELDDLVNLVDPRAKGLEDYTLDGIDDNRPQRATLVDEEIMRPAKAAPRMEAADAQISTPGPLADAFGDNGEILDHQTGSMETSERVQAALEAAGYDNTTAMEIATLHMEHPTLPEAILAQVPGVKKHHAAHAKVRKVVAEGVAAPALPVEA